MSEPEALVLKYAADVVERPGSWTQHETARDFAGRALQRVTDPAAVCYCACGAIDRAIVDLGFDGDGYRDLYDRVTDACGGAVALIRFNDAKDRLASEVAERLRNGARRFELEGPTP